MAGESPLSDEQWKRIYERILSGERLCDVSRELGFPEDAVSWILKRRFGWLVIRKRMSREASDAVYARVLQGESVAAISREPGMPFDTNLYRLLKNRYGYTSGQVRRRAVWAPTVKLDHATDVGLAYMAGIIDGEGSIIKVNRNRTHPVWTIKVNMTDRPIIEWLHSFGGTFCVRPSRDPARLKEQYEWKMSRSIDVRTILTALLPYLRVKRDKAELALDEFAADPIMMCEWGPERLSRDDRHRRPGPVWVYPNLSGAPGS